MERSEGLMVIKGTLDKIYQEKQIVTLWQNNGNERQVIKAIISEIKKDDSFVMKSADELSLAGDRFDMKLPLYFHGKEREITFKLETFYLSSGHLSFSLPKNVKLSAKRACARINLEKHLIRSVQHRKKVGPYGAGKAKSFSLNCLDISQTGLALELQAHHIGKYAVGDLIIINEVAGVKVNNIEGEVIHVSVIDEAKNNYRAGIVFGQALTTAIIRSILFAGNVKFS